MPQLNDEAVMHLNASLNELKVNTQTICVKMDQIYDSIEKLEKTVESINTAVSSQEKRLTVLEQAIPKNLIEDLAILKSSQQTHNKILWLVGGGVIASLIDILFKYMK